MIKDGYEVRVLDDMSRGQSSRLDGLDVEVIHGDVREHAIVHHALAGVDHVVHLAYVQGTQTFYTEPRLVLQTALSGMLNLLGCMEERGVRKLLLVSSSEAYQVASVVPTPETIPLTVPDPLNSRYSYGGGKIACELMANAWFESGALDVATIVRPHNIYGPDMGREHVIPEFCIRMNAAVQKTRTGVLPFAIQGSGEETRSFCYVTDCVQQMMLALLKGRGAEVFHIGTMEEKTISEVARAVAACYGREIAVQPGKLPKGSPARRLPDVSKMMALGYRPEYSFAEALPHTVEWYQKNA